MAPFTDTMSLIHCDERKSYVLFNLIKLREKTSTHQPFWSNIQQLDMITQGRTHAVYSLLFARYRSNTGSRNPMKLESMDLVLHKSDQWRHNYYQASQQHSGKLIS